MILHEKLLKVIYICPMRKRETKKMVPAQTWIEDTIFTEIMLLAQSDDLSLSAWIRRAIKEKLIRDKRP